MPPAMTREWRENNGKNSHRKTGAQASRGRGMGFVGIRKRTAFVAGKSAVFLSVAVALAGCQDGQTFNPFQKKAPEEAAAPVAKKSSGKVVERDVEVPEVFQKTEAGLWDGRPSLGGVWVAHPDVKEPERVIIRNTANGKFVVGALFRRERENPGPRLQVSSDAADALGMLAGQPMQLNVTALRREEVEVEPPAAAAPAPAGELKAPADVKAEPLDPIAGAAAAIAKAEKKPAAPAAAASAPVPKPKAKPRASSLSKPFIQIGIFSVEKNANNTATAMRQAGMIPTVKRQKLNGKAFWRVLVGPANTSADRAALLKKIKASGFTDAYFVTN
ncbi:SPOR domain-containing protein [Rhodobacteraceae bacterium D3-12]|nr:SPOR domain-containing protein [Rhodobacteraceae bacterium D3-12]